MKGDAEATVRDMLKRFGLFVYKPPDDARNWKPADFLTWEKPPLDGPWQLSPGHVTYYQSAVRCRWVEVKTVPLGRATWDLADLRPSQHAGIAEAMKLGIPYLLVVWWRARKLWTGVDLVAAQRSAAWAALPPNIRPEDPLWGDARGHLDHVVATLLR